MQVSIASEKFARAIAQYIQTQVPHLAKAEVVRMLESPGASTTASSQLERDNQILKRLDTCSPWTLAVHQALKQFGKEQEGEWDIFPKERPCKGEYLCDFMLFEKNYGCRVACESQWDHGADLAWEIDWAFDKLRGVKSDIKLFVYEGAEKHFRAAVEKHLVEYAQLEPTEVFVALRWKKPSFEASWFQPVKSGIQPVAFHPL